MLKIFSQMIFNKNKFLKKLDHHYLELNVVGRDYLFFLKSNWMVSRFAVEKLSFGIRFSWVVFPLFDWSKNISLSYSGPIESPFRLIEIKDKSIKEVLDLSIQLIDENYSFVKNKANIDSLLEYFRGRESQLHRVSERRRAYAIALATKHYDKEAFKQFELATNEAQESQKDLKILKDDCSELSCLLKQDRNLFLERIQVECDETYDAVF